MTTFVGTLGDDTHNGTEDVMYGLDGNDTLSGTGPFGTTMYGGNGNDSLSGGQFNAPFDTMFGGEGNDVLSGFGSFYGDTGNDAIGIGEAVGWAFGGEGDDTINIATRADGFGGVGYGGG